MVEKRIPTNLRTLMILEVIGNSDRPLTATQINESIGLPKQTVHRLCTTLEKEGFLVRESNSKRLMASPRLKLLASGILFSSQGSIPAHQILLQVAEEVSETVNLVIPEEEGMMYIDRVETDWPFRIQLPVGSHVPFHCTASGKVYLSSLSNNKRRALIRSLTLEAKTANTHRDPDELMAELNRISRQGYSFDNEEFMEGMVALAVPVLDTKGRYCCSLAFHGPTQRLSLDGMMKHLPVLQNGAKQLAQVFFN